MDQLVRSLEGETLWSHYVSEGTKKIWNIQLLMARELLRVCKKHGLRIWADGGTKLGAVRHQGYIPWDDDIDFIMMRDDYDKLQKLAPSEFSSPFFFQSAYTDKGYFRGHSQLRCDDTSAIRPRDGKFGISYNQGIFIDIFVSDGFPESVSERNWLMEIRNHVMHTIQCRNNPIYENYSLKNKYRLREAKKFLGDKFDWPDTKLYGYMEDCFRAFSIDRCERTSPLMFGYKPEWVFDTKFYDDGVMLPFEKIEIPLPSRYDEMLRLEFGDYMTPVKGAAFHGNGLVTDTEKTYKEYLDRMKISKVRLHCHYFISCLSFPISRLFAK